MARNYGVVLLPGDGIGPEVTQAAVAALNAVSRRHGFTLAYTELPAGGAAIDQRGDPMPDDVLERCLAADAVFLGAVGGPRWDHFTGDMRPESGLLKLRKGLGVFTNLRPVAVPDALAAASPLRPENVQGTDLLVVRELTGGIYFGSPKRREGEGETEYALDTMMYTAAEIERVARVAFDWARKRRGRLTSVDKANVLTVSQLWRDTVIRVHQADYAEVVLDHMYVDNAAMQLVLNPKQFDVILTGNLFGDILSDAAATLGGSLGLLPSASVGGSVGLFEPVHGSAPDLAGMDVANPVAALLSAAMLLDWLNESAGAGALRAAVDQALTSGARTADVWRPGDEKVGTKEMTRRVISHVNGAC